MSDTAKRRWWRRAAVAAVALGLTLPLAACGSSEPDATDSSSSLPATIRIGYQIILNSDLVIKNQGLLEEAFGDQVKIEWLLFDSGPTMNQAFVSNSLDIAMLGSSPTSRGLSNGIEYQVPWIFDVLGSAEGLAVKPEITSLEDLRGKTIATPLASTAHYSMLAALENAGIPATEVNIIDSDPPAALAAWKAGQIDGAWVWNPSLSEILADGGHLLVTNGDMADIGKATFDLAVISDAFVDKYPEAVQTWVDQQAQATQRIIDRDPAAIESIAAEAAITVEQVTEQLEGYIYLDAATQASQQYLGGDLGLNLYESAQFNVDLGQLTSTSDQQVYQDAVNPTFAAAAAEKV
ncbi:MAG: ABC transporter substrate-binding protein [Propionibacteriaceae bacterium]|nr:ABC transporter substrate-binding protein [Propionibacteriaceae bacterium]